MKTYSEINVDETPIVVLGCGHFFTAETLDGMIGMSDVYEVDGNGDYTSGKFYLLGAKVPGLYYLLRCMSQCPREIQFFRSNTPPSQLTMEAC